MITPTSTSSPLYCRSPCQIDFAGQPYLNERMLLLSALIVYDELHRSSASTSGANTVCHMPTHLHRDTLHRDRQRASSSLASCERHSEGTGSSQGLNSLKAML
jgi:hypothetical protein